MGVRSRELLILVTGDILCFVASLYLTLTLRYFTIPSGELLSVHIPPFVLLSVIWLFIFYIGGLYDKHTVFLKGILFSRILNTQFVNILIAALVFAAFPLGIAPKTNLVIYLVIFTIW